MTIKSKNAVCTPLLVGFCLLIYFFWFFLRPVEIIAVHKDGEFSSVLVRNFPSTDQGKIDWWLKNKEKLKEKYNTPNPAKDGFFSIVFWDFADGYKEEGKYDRRCFEDMKPPINCIEKKRVYSVSNSNNMGISFTTSSEIYRLRKNDK